VPAYVMVLVGGWFVTFAAYAFIFWGPAFVYIHKGFGLREAGLTLGLSLTVAGVLGIMAGAALADRLSRVYPCGRVLVVALGLLLGVPFLYWALHSSGKVVFLALFFVACFFMTWYHGPLTATLHDLTPARAHATALGLYYFVVNLLAVALAPPLVGTVADRYDLHTGMYLALVAQVAGGL